jgi:hypothetical protein
MDRFFDQRPVNKPVGSIKGGVFLDLLSNYQVFKIIFLLGVGNL